MNFDTNAAAVYLGVSPSYLEKLRVAGGGPTFIRVGRRVVYRQSDLDRFLDERAVRSTSEANP